MTDNEKKVLELATEGIFTDGSHHKQWYLDQIVRILTGSEIEYLMWVDKSQAGEDGPRTYSWDEGIAP